MTDGLRASHRRRIQTNTSEPDIVEQHVQSHPNRAAKRIPEGVVADNCENGSPLPREFGPLSVEFRQDAIRILGGEG